MRIRKITVVAASLAAIGATAVPAGAATTAATTAPATQAATRQFEGTIVSVDRSARTFRLRDAQRGTVTIRVTSSTRFQRVGGFAGLRAGLNRVEANVRRSNGAWVATFVERSGGGGGRHNGSDD
jgi:septal ring-binding cell division protein DamX